MDNSENVILFQARKPPGTKKRGTGSVATVNYYLDSVVSCWCSMIVDGKIDVAEKIYPAILQAIHSRSVVVNATGPLAETLLGCKDPKRKALKMDILDWKSRHK